MTLGEGQIAQRNWEPEYLFSRLRLPDEEQPSLGGPAVREDDREHQTQHQLQQVQAKVSLQREKHHTSFLNV
jgi:hypothetical protein